MKGGGDLPELLNPYYPEQCHLFFFDVFYTDGPCSKQSIVEHVFIAKCNFIFNRKFAFSKCLNNFITFKEYCRCCAFLVHILKILLILTCQQLNLDHYLEGC